MIVVDGGQEEDEGSFACLAGKRSSSTTKKKKRVEKARQGNGFNLKWNSFAQIWGVLVTMSQSDGFTGLAAIKG